MEMKYIYWYCLVYSDSDKRLIYFSNPSLSGDNTWTETYWPLHTPLKRETLTLSSTSSKVLEGHGVRKCAFWKRFLPQLANGKFDGRYGDFFYHNSPNIITTNGERVPSGEPTAVLTSRQHPVTLHCTPSGLVCSGSSSAFLTFGLLLALVSASSVF